MIRYSNHEPQPYSNRTSEKRSTYFIPASKDTTDVYDYGGFVVATPVAEVDSKTISSFDIKISTPIELAEQYLFEIYNYTTGSTVTLEKDNTNTLYSGYSIYTIDGLDTYTKYKILIAAKRTINGTVEESGYCKLDEYTDYIHININSLTETVPGSCSFNTTETCSATSVYEISADNTNIYLWEAIGTTISSGQGTTSIEIVTNGDSNIEFGLFCYCSNEYETKSIYNKYTHTRTEIVNTQLSIDSITETVSGYCEYNHGSTCEASSTYVASVSGSTIIYTWTVTGATLDSGQGTDTIVVSSDSDSNTVFTVSLNVTNSISDETSSSQYIHTRTEITEILDQHQTYDSTNIATEFI